MELESQKPPKCVDLTKAQERILNKLPMTEAEADKNGRAGVHRKTFLRLVEIGYAVWDTSDPFGPMLRRHPRV